jgi:hypothetical protein
VSASNTTAGVRELQHRCPSVIQFLFATGPHNGFRDLGHWEKPEGMRAFAELRRQYAQLPEVAFEFGVLQPIDFLPKRDDKAVDRLRLSGVVFGSRKNGRRLGRRHVRVIGTTDLTL